MHIWQFPEGFYEPNIISPPYTNPPWNDHKQKNIEIMFGFLFAYFIDDGPLYLFIPKRKDVEDYIWTYVAFYDLCWKPIGGVSASCHCVFLFTHIW